MKECPRCQRSLALDAFNFKSRKTGRRQVYCRECSREYVREHYARNVAYYCAKARARNEAERSRIRDWLLAYFTTHHCVDCSEADPVVLQFDHLVPSQKRLPVSILIVRGFAWSTILAEIDKCEVRCANCHLRRTARQFGWYRLRDIAAT